MPSGRGIFQPHAVQHAPVTTCKEFYPETVLRSQIVFTRLDARMLLNECTGRDIWPVELCRQRGVPQHWIDELADAFESGYTHDIQTIYHQDQQVNQFHGVQDLHLAYKLGEFLGIDTQRVTALALGRTAEVKAIKEAVEEV